MKILIAGLILFLTACKSTNTLTPPPPSVSPVKKKITDAKEVVELARQSNFDGKEIIERVQNLADSLRTKLEELKNRRKQQ